MNNDIKLIHGDCLIEMKNIPDKSIDMILCDLPYGTTACKWDVVIPFDRLWCQYKRIIKDGRPIVLFSSQPFTTDVINSNRKSFKYCWYWIKNQGTNFFHSKKQPIRKVEEICVFNSKIYYPQMTDGHKPTNSAKGCSNGSVYYGKNKRDYIGGSTKRFPTNVLEYKCVNNYKRIHPSEKPIELLEFLIKTYTIEGDTVLDNCIGSGITMIACINPNRKGIGIEKDEKYFEIAKNRVEKALEEKNKPNLFNL